LVVIQPEKPSNWLNTYSIVAEVYSSDGQRRLGAYDQGQYYRPGQTMEIAANNEGDITPGGTYKVRFATRDTISNTFSYGPFTSFTTPGLIQMTLEITKRMAGNTPYWDVSCSKQSGNAHLAELSYRWTLHFSNGVAGPFNQEMGESTITLRLEPGQSNSVTWQKPSSISNNPWSTSPLSLPVYCSLGEYKSSTITQLP